MFNQGIYQKNVYLLINISGDNLNHSKLVLVACISIIVPLTTAFLGFQGTIIGSVISSVLYNVLSGALSDVVEDNPSVGKKISRNIEADIAYVFPLIVMLCIQFLLILAFLSEWDIVPDLFLNIYLSVQGVAANNLYRILGISSIIMSLYPFILTKKSVKRYHGFLIFLIGLMFLLKGFSDFGGIFSVMYNTFFRHFDFPIAIITFILLAYVVCSLLVSINSTSNKVSKPTQGSNVVYNDFKSNERNLRDSYGERRLKDRYDERNLRDGYGERRLKDRYDERNLRERSNSSNSRKNVRKRKKTYFKQPDKNSTNINESIDNIKFESNDLLDDYKK